MSSKNPNRIFNYRGEKYNIKVSHDPTKKYDVYIFKTNEGSSEGSFVYLLSFGSRQHEHYYDQVGDFSYLNHENIERLRNFNARFKHIIEKNKHNPNSPIFWSSRLLW